MGQLPRDILLKLLGTFEPEAKEHMSRITRDLLHLEEEPESAERQKIMDRMFREAHSIKGSAGTLGLDEIATVAHGMEDVLGAVKRRELELTSNVADTVLGALDAMTGLLQAAMDDRTVDAAEVERLTSGLRAHLGAHTAPRPRALEAAPKDAAPPAEAPKREHLVPARPAGPPGPEDRPDKTVRVEMNKLDAFLTQSEELVLAKIRVDQRLAEVRDLDTGLSALWQRFEDAREIARQLRRVRPDEEMDLLVEGLKQHQSALKGSAKLVQALVRELVDDSQHLALATTALQQELKGLRLMPVATVFDPMLRMVRDLARREGKRVRLEVNGADLELDKGMLQEIKDPLVHLLRNAVDHGIEPPDQRALAGKPEEALLRVGATQRGNRVAIEVSDDGRGIEPDRVAERAIAQGLVDPTLVPHMSAEEKQRLVFLPGFSTAAAVTELSGRGVGLDVVKENVARLGGLIELASSAGAGTSFLMLLPLTLATSQGLLVEASGAMYAVPVEAVERIVRLPQVALTSVRGRTLIRIDDTLIPFALLSEVLELSRRELVFDRAGMLAVLIIASAEKRIALGVDRLVAEQEIVVKSLGTQLVRVRNVSGATILGDGQVVPILSGPDLVRSTLRDQVPVPQRLSTDQAPQRPTLLVADDSITSRTLEQMVLEMAGYRVITAKDGAEALELLAQNDIAVLISDVQMPRMDGLELTRTVRRDQRWRDLPVILVTSLGSEEDKARGIEVGADAYIVKRDFQQGRILELIEQLL